MPDKKQIDKLTCINELTWIPEPVTVGAAYPYGYTIPEGYAVEAFRIPVPGDTWLESPSGVAPTSDGPALRVDPYWRCPALILRPLRKVKEWVIRETETRTPQKGDKYIHKLNPDSTGIPLVVAASVDYLDDPYTIVTVIERDAWEDYR